MDGLPPPNALDAAAMVVVALGTVRGYFRRLSGEMASLLSMIVALLVGLRCYHPFGAWLLDHSRLAPQPARAVAFAGVALGCAVVMLALRIALKRVIRLAIEERADRIGGLVAGFVRSSVLVLIVFVVMNMWPQDYLNRVFGRESLLGTVLLRAAPGIAASPGERMP